LTPLIFLDNILPTYTGEVVAKKCPKCNAENPDNLKFCGECGTQLASHEDVEVTETMEAPKEELTTGSTFAGRYQIIEELGKGGMGRVYRALDKELNEEVAIKLVKPEIAKDKKTIDRFKNELKFTRKISHRNVGRMYELMEERGSHFITMEYVPGQDLRGLIRQTGELTTGKAIAIAKEICEGLEEAHHQGVVHRDLKPSNIIIDVNGNARILDFGIARSIWGKGITGAGTMIGTPEYMSPEQIEGRDVDERSDIYSLGVILYEMVTGRVPFEGDTPFTIGVKHKSELPQNPKEINAQIPDDLNDVILKCLEKDKEKRYPSAGEVRSELENIEKGIHTTERFVPKGKAITSKEITVTFGAKKLFIPALLFIAFVIIIMVIWQPWSPKETSPVLSDKPSIAVLPFVDLSPQKDQEYFCDGMTDEIIAKLSRFEGWKVIPRTSMMRYKNADKDIQEIGQELEVATILEGSLRKEGDDIRVNAKLIRVENSNHLWSETYEEKLESVFAIQGDVAEKIAAALKVELSPEDKERLTQKPTENLTAYDYYLKGREFYFNYRRQDNENAIELFNKALELDPDYALAYAGLGDAYAQRAFRFGFPRSWLDSAIEASEKAISKDPNSSEAYKALGLAYEYKGWFQKALDADLKAVKLNPNNKSAVGNVGWVNWFIGELVEAMKWFRKDLALDLTDAFSHYAIGDCYFALDDYVKAEQWFRKSLDLQPDLVFALQELSAKYLAEGKYQKAIQSAQKILSADPNEFIGLIAAGSADLYAGHYDRAKQYFRKAMAIDSTRIDLLVFLGYAHWKTSQQDEAQKMFSQSLDLAQKHLEDGDEYFFIPYYIAAVHAIQGNKEEALMWLEKAFKAGCRKVRLCQGDPMLENLHADDRFQAMIEHWKKVVDEMRKRVEENNW
jgi:serine/threonine protein kinase/tetratricopeptide (TPR) repeat protein